MSESGKRGGRGLSDGYQPAPKTRAVDLQKGYQAVPTNSGGVQGGYQPTTSQGQGAAGKPPSGGSSGRRPSKK